jgi:uncharacterized membrane protein (Fun14 family)
MLTILIHVAAHPMPITPRVEEKESSLPKSSISMYELGFGTVAGICAGVFVKKGAKAVAWLMGGIFVLLQVCYCTFKVLWLRVCGN